MVMMMTIAMMMIAMIMMMVKKKLMMTVSTFAEQWREQAGQDSMPGITCDIDICNS